MLLLLSLEILLLQERASLKKVPGFNEAKVKAVQEVVHAILRGLCSRVLVAEACVLGDLGTLQEAFRAFQHFALNYLYFSITIAEGNNNAVIPSVGNNPPPKVTTSFKVF